MGQLTDLLGRVQGGDAKSRDALFVAAYAELHGLAQARLRHGGRNALLDTTGLVHESYLRFARAGELRCRGPTGLLRLRVAGDAFGNTQ